MKSWIRRGAAALPVFVPFSLYAQTPPEPDEEEVVKRCNPFNFVNQNLGKIEEMYFSKPAV